VIGVADTNCNPDEVDYIIPGNDDALRAIRLIANTVSQAYLDGRAVFEAQQKELAEQMEKQRQLQAQQAAAAREAAARAAAEAAARRAAEGKEAAEAGGQSAEAAAAGEAAGKPRTTIKKTLQRKTKPRKAETDAQAESAPGQAEAEEQAETSAGPGPSEVQAELSPSPIVEGASEPASVPETGVAEDEGQKVQGD
jgi:small subunit ribosomal protein S2